MRKTTCAILSICLTLCTSWVWAGDCAELVVTGHPSYPPVSWKDGDHIKGASAKMMEMIGRDLGLEVTVKSSGSWAAAQEAVRKGEVDMIFGIYYDDTRAEYMHYVEPSYIQDPVVLAVPKGKSFPFAQWADLKDRKGVTNQGESYGTEFDAYMAKHLNVIRGDGVEACFRMLLRGEGDYLIIGLYPGMAEIARLDLDDAVEILPTQLNAFKMFTAFSKKSPCYDKYHAAMSERIKTLVENGTVQTLLILSQAEWDRALCK